MDIKPQGELINYFKFAEEARAQYLLFEGYSQKNPNKMSDTLSTLVLENNENLRKKYKVNKSESSVDTVRSKLWESEISYGILALESDDEDDLLFFYVIDEVDIELYSAKEKYKEGAMPYSKAKNKVVDEKRLYTAFFSDGT